jgi:hypothetical protein
LNCLVTKKKGALYFFVLIFKKNFTVSHIPERKEKDCLNCGTIVQGHYCHHCGQENVVPKETFWHMVTHFFYDITHFDSNFFHTVHHLILKPGFLSKEYMAGRRANYLHPIKMYVFSSAIFFLLFFSFFNETGVININAAKPVDAGGRAEYIKRLETRLKKDTGNLKLKAAIAIAKDTTQPISVNDFLKEEGENAGITFMNKSYKSMEEYDSIEKTLPRDKRDGWVMRRLVKKQTDLNKKYHENPNEAAKKLAESVLHRLPYMLFVSLPLFALILKLVYFRRNQFYFADHGVFTIHLYVFSFILLLAVFALGKLENATGWGFINFIVGILFVALFFYLYKAMRKFYGQRRGKTFLKFILVSILSLVMMLILFVLFMFFSAVTL